ncbi:hypothetical protein [Flavobacterium sp. 3HN19-14]|uniref:hypothetical protein n=1 Tax=Flavobacterium sp. 3HN19-14 TaxID=3448133 RepID=UPI003EDEC65B
MENHDKIYEQIKDASRKAEEQPFPAMDKVWSRVEDKLDAKVLEKQNSRWKKIAVAASILLVASLGYQLLKPQQDFKENKIEKSTEVTVAPQSPGKPDTKIEIQQNASAPANPEIKKNANQILQRQIAAPQPVAVADEAIEMAAPAGNPGFVEMKEKEEDGQRKKKPFTIWHPQKLSL